MTESSNSYHLKFKALRIGVLIPTFNNGDTLKNVIESLFKYTSDIIVVNDGSTDNTQEILSHYPQLQVVSYSKNAGKGSALRRGFKYAVNAGYEYAISIDSDGQHFADDLPAFIDKLESEGPSL